MTDLLETQRGLQATADEIVRDLQLNQLLGSIGTPIRVGSSAMGLMVQRDIDITVVCPMLDAATLAAFSLIGAGLMQRSTTVASVRFRNDSGHWNKEPDNYPDGLYLGLSVTGPEKAMWTLDIWAVDNPERQPDLGHLRSLLPRILPDHRLDILQIKHALADRRSQGPRLPSVLVYEAVVDHGVQTIDDFDRWHAKRGQ